MEGWIKLHYRIKNWGWWNTPNTRNMFLYLLITANSTNGEFKGIPIKRGQIATSLPQLAINTGLTIQQARTTLINMVTTGEITDEQQAGFRIITIKNFNLYQENNRQVTGDHKGKQQADIPNIKKKEDKNITPIVPFDTLWEMYPRKVGKTPARLAWGKLTDDERELAIASLPAQCQQDQWRRDEGKYIPYPATWINQRRWEDVIESPVPQQPEKSQSEITYEKQINQIIFENEQRNTAV